MKFLMKISGTGNIHQLFDSIKKDQPINYISYNAIQDHAIYELDLKEHISVTVNNKKLIEQSNRFTVTCLLPTGTVSEFKATIDQFENIIQIKQLSRKNEPLRAFEMDFFTDKSTAVLNKEFLKFGQETRIDICLRPKTPKRLVIFDMDSTLIQQEVIDELAREAGVYDLVSSITERAMRGELDFNSSLQERVKTLKNQNVEIIEKVKNRIVLMPGAKELTVILSKLGITTAVVSGGFLPLANYIKDTLGLNYAFANTLVTDGDVLTGQVTLPIVNAERKRDLLSTIAQLHDIPKELTMAVGDGANDLLMLSEAGFGVAFNAKPRVQEQAQARINQPSLFNVLYLLGYTDEELDLL
jgi:phosphoserine phosphatase SerB